MSMSLEDWLDREGKSASGFGAELGLKSPASISRIIRKRAAESRTVRLIYQGTGGAVTPNDIFGLYPADQTREAAE